VDFTTESESTMSSVTYHGNCFEFLNSVGLNLRCLWFCFSQGDVGVVVKVQRVLLDELPEWLEANMLQEVLNHLNARGRLPLDLNTVALTSNRRSVALKKKKHLYSVKQASKLFESRILLAEVENYQCAQSQVQAAVSAHVGVVSATDFGPEKATLQSGASWEEPSSSVWQLSPNVVCALLVIHSNVSGPQELLGSSE
jgi:hypothetical protein